MHQQSQQVISKVNYASSGGHVSCLKSKHEKRVLSKEIDSLSGALAKKQYKLEQTLTRMKQERKQFNKARRTMEKCEN